MDNNANYKVTIIETSKTLSARERIRVKDTSNAIKLDEAATSAPLVLTPDYFVILSIHNDKADPTDYENYVIVDKEGNKYVTGSPSFWNAFTEIYEEMSEESEEYSIEVYKMDSKNYKGKQFLTCSIM